MYKIGECIHYGSAGLCRIDDVTGMRMSEEEAEKVYYRLIPLNGCRSVIYTPVDNQKVLMRMAMNKAEAEDLIRQMPAIEMLAVPTGKQAENAYKTALATADCKTWAALMKTLLLKKENRARMGKKATSTEERYYREVNERLSMELAHAVGIMQSEAQQLLEEELKSV